MTLLSKDCPKTFFEKTSFHKTSIRSFCVNNPQTIPSLNSMWELSLYLQHRYYCCYYNVQDEIPSMRTQ